MNRKLKNVNDNLVITVNVLNKAVYTIFQGMDNIIKDLRGESKTDIKNIDDKVVKLQTYVNSLQEETAEVKNDIRRIKDDINGIKADLSDTPTRKEFSPDHTLLAHEYSMFASQERLYGTSELKSKIDQVFV